MISEIEIKLQSERLLILFEISRVRACKINKSEEAKRNRKEKKA